MKTIKYKYQEDVTFDKIKKYIDSTYGAHYVNDGLQVIDVWESRGTLMSTATDTAIKYLMRFGKKDGMNEKDLLKAIHYIMLMLYELEKKKGDVFNETYIRTSE